MNKHVNENRRLKSAHEALLSGDPEKMREHLTNYPQGSVAAEDMKVNELKLTIHKNRVHWRDCPAELLKESVWWLIDNEYSRDMD